MINKEREKEIREMDSVRYHLPTQELLEEIDRLRAEHKDLLEDHATREGYLKQAEKERDQWKETFIRSCDDIKDLREKLEIAVKILEDIRIKDPSWQLRDAMCKEALSKIRGEKC